MSGRVQVNRWRPRIRLRTFLVLFTLLSLWLGWRVYVIRTFDRPLASLHEAGIPVMFETEHRWLRTDQWAERSWNKPIKLARLLFGLRPFNQDNPRRVYLCEGRHPATCIGGWSCPPPVLNGDLERQLAVAASAMKQLTSIEQVYIHGGRISEQSLSLLSEIPQLAVLVMHDCAFDPNDLEAFSQLAVLKINGPDADPNGLAQLQESLPNCDVSVLK